MAGDGELIMLPAREQMARRLEFDKTLHEKLVVEAAAEHLSWHGYVARALKKYRALRDGHLAGRQIWVENADGWLERWVP